MNWSLLVHLFLQVALPILILVAAGALWPRYHRELSPDVLRMQLSRLALYLFAPALSFSAVAGQHLTAAVWSIPLLMIAGTLPVGLILYVVLYRTRVGAPLSNATRAALMLAGMFGNTFFIGFPVLTFLYGPEGSRYTIFADSVGSTPLVWSLGVWIAAHLGAEGRGRHGPEHFARAFFRLPPVWAFWVALLVNWTGWDVSALIHATHLIGEATVPVMMFVLGLSIPWRTLRPSKPILAVAAMKLLVLPALIAGLAWLFLRPLGQAQQAVILEGAMPTMLMSLVLSDQFGLDTEVVALTIGWSTLLFWVTLPVWLVWT